jgi:hypothetical protein
MARRNLVLVARPRQANIIADFQKIVAHCREIASDIHPIGILDAPRSLLRTILLAANPTLVFAPQRLLFFHPLRGAVFRGKLLPKSEEYRRLEAAGIAVPPWKLLTRSHSPDLSALGRHVVTKPDYGARGADVRIRLAARARWKPPNTPVRLAARAGVIAQKFIYTGRWPISYRVGTLFGRILYSWKVEASHTRRPLESPDHFDGNAITSSHKGSSFWLNDDPEIAALAEAAHHAFPTIPLLGTDILREEPGGRLYVIEVNSSGETWHFSSRTGKSIQQWAGIDFAAQHGGLRHVAEVLVDETRRRAR